ncbi:MAG TPA: nitroreductase family deazaflavin-dependent oxidoreductase [Pseudonocardiaceae bacterium]|jgi:deazaflavin-dependent oxidoreductase (nitroreductase family)|nr:nitroreductase family deazaflavin-dependent oxidoreductase [Pseudonocardiaceae bacterium]
MADEQPEATTKQQFNNFNDSIIAEFRANGGKVGGQFEGMTMLLLRTKGARSGLPRTTPTAYLRDGERYVVIASKGGADTNPAWYHNLVSAPTARIEVGTETLDVAVREVHGDERDRLYAKQAEIIPGFAEYQVKTKRLIPVIALTKV